MPKLIQRIKLPTKGTLNRYGLTLAEWKAILAGQNGVCAVCKRVPPSLRFCVDHVHLKGWKKMSKEERRKTVRGILCARCNHQFVCRGITIVLAEAVADYLRQYEARCNGYQK